MKKLFKSLVSLTAAGTMLLSTTAFAASVPASISTVTTYTPTTAHVVSTVSGFDNGDMVTYLAVKGNDATNVGTNGENIVYIGQDTADASGKAVFSYDLTGVAAAVGTYATIKSGSNNDEVSNGSDEVVIDKITVNYVYVDEVTKQNKVVDTQDVYVGEGESKDVTFALPSGFDAKFITVGSDEYEYQSALTVKAGSTVNVYLQKIDTPVVYQLDGVAFNDGQAWKDADDKTYYEKTGFVRVVGAVAECGFTFANGSTDYAINGVSKFPVSDLDTTNGGYYAVQIVDDESLDAYVPTAYAIDSASTEVDVVKVTVE